MHEPWEKILLRPWFEHKLCSEENSNGIECLMGIIDSQHRYGQYYRANWSKQQRSPDKIRAKIRTDQLEKFVL